MYKPSFAHISIHHHTEAIFGFAFNCPTQQLFFLLTYSTLWALTEWPDLAFSSCLYLFGLKRKSPLFSLLVSMCQHPALVHYRKKTSKDYRFWPASEFVTAAPTSDEGSAFITLKMYTWRPMMRFPTLRVSVTSSSILVTVLKTAPSLQWHCRLFRRCSIFIEKGSTDLENRATKE